MLWMYMAMLETAEQKDKIAYIYENYADDVPCSHRCGGRTLFGGGRRT